MKKFRIKLRSIVYQWVNGEVEAEYALHEIVKLIDGQSVKQLNLCTRTLHALLRAGYETIDDLTEASEKELKAIPLIGFSSLIEIAAALDKFERGGTELNCIAVRTDLFEGDD
jgi:DNA-directed RNA polymerase alpha subunit